jgi:hypothetical protein
VNTPDWKMRSASDSYSEWGSAGLGKLKGVQVSGSDHLQPEVPNEATVVVSGIGGNINCAGDVDLKLSSDR